MPRFLTSAEPSFHLAVEAKAIRHLPHHAHRAVRVDNVQITSQDTLAFTGAGSQIAYSISDWPELALAGSFTLLARIRFASPGAEQFVLGRYGLNFLTVPEGWPQGNFCNAPQSLTPSNSRAFCAPANFHDVLLRFRPATATERAGISIEVYASDTGLLIGRNHELPRSFDQIPFGREDAPFVIGHASGYAPFIGEISMLQIWDQWLETEAPKLAREVPVGALPLPVHASTELSDAKASNRWQHWLQTRTAFPIAAWGYFHRYTTSAHDYAVYRAAGLTMVMAPLATAELAEQANLDTVIGLWEDNGDYAELYQHPSRLADYLAFAQHRLHRCVGYMLADEPRFGGPGIAELAPGFQTIYERDPTALPMVNLMTYAYTMGGGFGNYVEEVIRTTHPAFLVADSYVLFADGRSNDDQFYANTAIVRQKALQTGIGFMGFILTTGHRRHFPEHSFRTASVSDLHWQANTLLAYGAQGLWYYNYRIGGEGFDEAFVTHADGQPTESYARIKALNDGILAHSQLLLGLQSRQIHHTATSGEFLPEFTSQYADGCIHGLKALQGHDLLVGELIPSDSSRDSASYLMLVNKRHAATPDETTANLTNEITVRFEPNWQVHRFDNQTAQPTELASSEIVLTLRGGERALFRLQPPAH